MANADTLKGADAYSGNALPAAKVQQNSDISKENQEYADIYANRTERNIYRSDIRPSYIKMYHPVYLGNLDRGIDSFVF